MSSQAVLPNKEADAFAAMRPPPIFDAQDDLFENHSGGRDLTLHGKWVIGCGDITVSANVNGGDVWVHFLVGLKKAKTADDLAVIKRMKCGFGSEDSVPTTMGNGNIKGKGFTSCSSCISLELFSAQQFFVVRCVPRFGILRTSGGDPLRPDPRRLLQARQSTRIQGNTTHSAPQ